MLKSIFHSPSRILRTSQFRGFSWRNCDPLSRLTTESQTASGQTKTVWYAYDNNSNLTTLTHPDGPVQSYTYDALNRNTTVGYSGQTIATYGFSGLTLTSLAYNNTRTTTYSYDPLQRLSNINPNTASISTESLTYDDSSLITADGTKSYLYDNLKRLISATPTNTGNINQNTESYTYDKTGNRKTDASSSYATNLLDQYTSQSGGVNKNYTYDANGNLKSDGSKTYTYDYNNRLVQVTQSGATLAQYQYDILGRRIQKTTPTEATIYVYAGDNIVQELKIIGALTLKKEYINGIGTDSFIAYDAQESTNQDKITFCQVRVLPYSSDFNTYGYSSIISDCNATITSNTGVTTKRYYYHTNHLGSVIWLTDNSGNVLQTYAYDSFGKAYIVNGTWTLTTIDGNTNLYGNTRLYTGREYDKELNLYYLRARYYDASTGKFISRDPIGQRDQVNLYTYVSNSPLNYADRMGLEKVLILRGEDSTDGYDSDLVKWTTQVEIDYYLSIGIKKENILIHDVRSIAMFNSELNRAYKGKYKEVVFMWHWTPGSITISSSLNERITKNTLNELNVPSDFNIPIRLDSLILELKDYFQTLYENNLLVK